MIERNQDSGEQWEEVQLFQDQEKEIKSYERGKLVASEAGRVYREINNDRIQERMEKTVKRRITHLRGWVGDQGVLRKRPTKKRSRKDTNKKGEIGRDGKDREAKHRQPIPRKG